MMAGCVLFTDDCAYMFSLYLANMLNDRLLAVGSVVSWAG